MRRKQAAGTERQSLPMVHPHAAAIDVGATMHMAAVGPDRTGEPVRSFGTFTADLHRLADWFEVCGVTSVVMESTGVYWIPVFEILQDRGLEVFLVNARDAKQVPGRKTDVNDAQWLQRLHAYGLLRASFQPKAEIAELRAYLRQRERLLEYAASHIQHMQKALTEMNLQLHHVVSDITGATGMRIIRAILAGERDPAVLASLRDIRCHSSPETIEKGLTGHYRAEHLFALEQALALYDTYQHKVAACDQRIEAVLKALSTHEPDPGPLPAPRRRMSSQPNEPSFDLRSALYAVLGPGPDQDPWPRAFVGAQTGCRVRHGSDGLAQQQALHLLALPGARQQDLRWQGAVLPDAPVGKSGGGTSAAGGRDDWQDGDGAGRLLSAPVDADRQGQSRHGNRPQDSGAVLQRPAPRYGLCGSGSVLLRGAISEAGDR